MANDLISLRVYLDTNVYCRPFDDQSQPDINAEANALLEILSEVKANRIGLLCSDILSFEVENILSVDKRTKVKDFLNLCTSQIENSEEVLALGKQIEKNCQTQPRDALHIASAISGQASCFLSCDKKITTMAKENCYDTISQSYHETLLRVMNPVNFVEKLLNGELK